MQSQQKAGMAAEDDPDIDDNIRFQQRTWMVERVSWVLMFLVIVAAILGLFASGPLSNARATDPNGHLALRYQRFARMQAPTTMRLSIAPGTLPHGESTVWVGMNEGLLRDLELERIRPEPISMRASGDGLELEFRVTAQREAGVVVFRFTPQRFGTVRGAIGLVGQAPARFTQFVYP